MGARQSTYLADVDAHEPQPQHHQPEPAQGSSAAPTATAAAGSAGSAGYGGAHRPPPLNLSAPPAPTPARRRPPICSGLDTVDLASTHPHSPIPSPAASGLVDVWIIAGQSNAVGDNSEDGTPIPAASQPLPGLVLSYDSTGRWRDAVPNIHAGVHGYDREPSCGPAIAFGRTLVGLGLSGRVGLVPCAKGATNLFHDWRPAGGGDLYGTMIARTKAALAAPLPGGGNARLRGMIWVQGEADAEEKVGPAPSEAYGANLTAFVQAVRRDLASYHAQLPILLGVMSLRKRDCFPYLAAVRRAQLGTPVPGLLRVDLSGYEFFEQYGGFHVHLTKDGATALGTTMAHIYYSTVVRAGLPWRPANAAAAAVTAFALSGGGAATPPAPPAVSDGGSGGSAAAAAAVAPAAAAADTAAVQSAEAATLAGEGATGAEVAGRSGEGEGAGEGEGEGGRRGQLASPSADADADADADAGLEAVSGEAAASAAGAAEGAVGDVAAVSRGSQGDWEGVRAAGAGGEGAGEGGIGTAPDPQVGGSGVQ
ncbi:hypothetical protein PLESTB_000410000 [Pleodorina starrii]|uniref:Sialate O-acetylesterase domain-containing protein n=1 Tax=Pleodorina starrii TaxID=330485 RepID=A0A9W6BER6_9CHLO|nr:hypothetical protein PLESTB_000410000 [Pleodorina starrii]GLC77503.1 hypothetical protein PLESTF_001945400 [Pleodorina starrii]